MALSQVDMDRLEAMVDNVGLSWVVDALAEICFLKADHIEQTWQDRALALAWSRAGTKLVAITKLKTLDI